LKPITEPSSNVGSANSDELSIAVRALLAILRGYKILISPYFRGSCRFLPSCADYASIAVARHGAVHGGWLAAKRLARCHPMCAAGHDPVPQ
jgi:putative membrane protein insertion efficiency factor